MPQTIDAIFDGSVFQPAEPVELEPNTRVRVTIERIPRPETSQTSFLRTARSLNLDGPPDWSAHIEDYLYNPASSDDPPLS